jgi:hypothetical protein
MGGLAPARVFGVREQALAQQSGVKPSHSKGFAARFPTPISTKISFILAGKRCMIRIYKSDFQPL